VTQLHTIIAVQQDCNSKALGDAVKWVHFG